MKILTKNCKTCQKVFKTDRPDKLYCSYTCSKQHNRLKKVTELFKLTPEELIIRERIMKEE